RREGRVVPERPRDSLGKHLPVGEAVTPTLRPSALVSPQGLEPTCQLAQAALDLLPPLRAEGEPVVATPGDARRGGQGDQNPETMCDPHEPAPRTMIHGPKLFRQAATPIHPAHARMPGSQRRAFSR